MCYVFRPMNIEKKILIIEDDVEIANLIEMHLKDQNWQVEKAASGELGYGLALSGEYDLVVLDLMLPELDGLEICRRLRQEREYTPILMLTSRADELDRVLGLELGADDYLTKPFSIRELIARIRAIFRRLEISAENNADNGVREVLEFADLRLDLPKRKVTLSGEKVDLTAKEYDLLELFMRHPNQVLTRDQIYDRIWGYDFGGESNIIEVYIRYLRSKLEANAEPRLLHTVRGVGYALRES